MHHYAQHFHDFFFLTLKSPLQSRQQRKGCPEHRAVVLFCCFSQKEEIDSSTISLMFSSSLCINVLIYLWFSLYVSVSFSTFLYADHRVDPAVQCLCYEINKLNPSNSYYQFY